MRPYFPQSAEPGFCPQATLFTHTPDPLPAVWNQDADGAADPAGGTGHRRGTIMRARMTKRHCTRVIPAARARLREVASRVRQASEAGASTAEYAMTMLVACGFAGVLLSIVRSSPVKSLLVGIIQKALNLG